MIRKLGFSQAKALLDARPDAVLLDVRDEAEFLAGHAEGAVLLPEEEISAGTAAAAIPQKTSPVLVYCRTGRRSAGAARALEALGYTAVYDLGGLVGWPYGLAFG